MTPNNFQGLRGCVTQRRSRATGHLYGLYNAEQARMDTAAGAWATVCEDHDTICNHDTLALARYHLPSGDWCERCMAERPAEEEEEDETA